MLNDIESVISLIPEITSATKYWFIRTEGGSLYETYIASSTVGIGYGKISTNELQKLDIATWVESAKKLVTKHYPDKKIPGLGASQLFTFFHKVRKRDRLKMAA